MGDNTVATQLIFEEGRSHFQNLLRAPQCSTTLSVMPDGYVDELCTWLCANKRANLGPGDDFS